jgi:hypothetical protein
MLKLNWIIKILGIIYLPVFYLKHDVSEIIFCHRLQLSPINSEIPCLQSRDRIQSPKHRVLNTTQEDEKCPEF